MKTVTKALGLLNLFLTGETERALGSLAKGSGLDKATARRMLLAMCEYGLIEQDKASRLYSLGPAVLALARAREAAQPILSVVDPVVRNVALDLGETCHFSVAMNGALSVLTVAEGNRPLRVHIREGDTLPLHTSGAGIAFLAASPPRVLEDTLLRGLPSSTAYSYTTPDSVRKAVSITQSQGYACTDQTHEEDVAGTAIAVLDAKGAIVGVIGVATPKQRLSDDFERKTASTLRHAAMAISERL